MTEDEQNPLDTLLNRLSTQEREEESPDRAFARALFGGASVDNPDDEYTSRVDRVAAEDDQPDDLTETIRALFRS